MRAGTFSKCLIKWVSLDDRLDVFIRDKVPRPQGVQGRDRLPSKTCVCVCVLEVLEVEISRSFEVTIDTSGKG